MGYILNILSQLLQIAGALAILAAAYTYVVHRKQLNFDVIRGCSEKFQKVMVEMRSSDPHTAEQAERQYVDLCNEQLFYFGARYLPDAVVDEWLEGMIDYLPQLKAVGTSVGEAPSPHTEDYRNKEAVSPELLAGYPRISEAFLVSNGDSGARPYDLDNPEERLQLIQHVKGRVNREDDLLDYLADTLKRAEHRILTLAKARKNRAVYSRSEDTH